MQMAQCVKQTMITIRMQNYLTLKTNTTMSRFYDDYEDDSYGKYSGTYVQDEEGWSDEMIDDALDGCPDAYWNIN